MSERQLVTTECWIKTVSRAINYRSEKILPASFFRFRFTLTNRFPSEVRIKRRVSFFSKVFDGAVCFSFLAPIFFLVSRGDLFLPCNNTSKTTATGDHMLSKSFFNCIFHGCFWLCTPVHSGLILFLSGRLISLSSKLCKSFNFRLCHAFEQNFTANHSTKLFIYRLPMARVENNFFEPGPKIAIGITGASKHVK